VFALSTLAHNLFCRLVLDKPIVATTPNASSTAAASILPGTAAPLCSTGTGASHTLLRLHYIRSTLPSPKLAGSWPTTRSQSRLIWTTTGVKVRFFKTTAKQRHTATVLLSFVILCRQHSLPCAEAHSVPASDPCRPAASTSSRASLSWL
jgi:hypothetical protein